MEEEKVWMASYNLEDGAQLWYMQIQMDMGTPSWRHFKELLNLRYGPPLRSAPLAELAECRRTRTVADYMDRFQALLARAGPLLEEQCVQLFTGGLMPPLSLDVRIQNPQTLDAAMIHRAGAQGRDQTCLAGASPASCTAALPVPPGPKPALPVEGRPIKRLTQAEQEERRRLRLCYNYDEKFTRGHNHVCKWLFLLEGVEEEDDAALPERAEAADQEEAPMFSLQALAGVAFTDTMQIMVGLDAASLVALLDSGSTQNFISEAATHRSGLPIHRRARLTAMCLGVIRGAPLKIGGDSFPADLYVMPLAGYDIIIGTRWLATLRPIVWDFNNHAISFTHKGRGLCSQGLAGPRTSAVSATTASSSLLEELLDSFSDVFGEPQGLPQPHSRDHAITLVPGSPPVGKTDGSWRFCVDYRALNAITVKDSFPIPVIDELLDELHGTQFFTKLDLRSGYHQVLMKPEDIDKTAFRTHDGFYEFLVMPFGLCNAPVTFQALMNDMLRAYLRWFVLVFFDDILICSSSWADHLRHIRVAMEVLRQHRLFVKRSKCSFGVNSVSYLGHIISAEGVAMDPAKVQAIHDWPIPHSLRAVRGFLGLAGYYRKFVHNYGAIAAPLTALLKKEGFTWNDDAAAAFSALKAAVTSAPVLALPDFAKPFVVVTRLPTASALDPALVAIHDEVRAGTRAAPWVVVDGMVTYDGRLYIPPSSPLLQEIMAVVHDDGHEGVHRMLHHLHRDFHFPNMRRLVQDFVRACPTCQRYKSEHLHPVGLLMPLPIPTAVWADIGLDFVEALPPVNGKSVILSVVDRFSKYCHFIPLAHPYTAETMAQALFADIVRLHGVPQSMMSDRDPVFTSTFWRELMRLMGTKLHMSSAFHL
ncbi:uncharacterized protein LOC120678111 [Panicum virgatum]|uniref:uncharacterized protein LOC120678111 n=1 Tax=Panicum virgatum TaxID=38727 RepID=UPI0019D50FBA|nr:uncharacterized protein LOC120678111 [Panicum virgatum]